MDFPAACKIQNATRSDVGPHDVMAFARLDRARSRLLATDGRLAVMVPVTMTDADREDAADHPGDALVSRASLDHATKGKAKGKATATIRVNGAVVSVSPHDGTAAQRGASPTLSVPHDEHADVASFPDIDRVVPKVGDGVPGYHVDDSARVRLSVSLLLDLLSALGAAPADGAQVEIIVHRDAENPGALSGKPIIVRAWPEGVETVGVLMTCNV
jgi:hypothetical protein